MTPSSGRIFWSRSGWRSAWSGSRSGSRRAGAVMFMASAAPLGLAVLAMTGHRYDAVYQHFLGLFMAIPGRIAGLPVPDRGDLVPGVRRRPRGPAGVGADFGGLGRDSAWSVPETVDVFDTGLSPLAAAGGGGTRARIGAAWRCRDSRRAAVAAGMLVAGITLGWETFFPHADLGAIAFHLIILAMLVVGAVFDDVLAAWARSCGAFMLLLLGFVSAIGYTGFHSSFRPSWPPWYPALVAAVACGYGFLVRDHTYLASAFVCLAAWLGWSGWQRLCPAPEGRGRPRPDRLGARLLLDRHGHQLEKSRPSAWSDGETAGENVYRDVSAVRG